MVDEGRIMKITLLANGSSGRERLIRRWGVSFLIGDEVLFDTFGDAAVFLKNLRKFGVDLAKIKHIVLSHDHWDHVTGLWSIAEACSNASVYICPHFSPEIKAKAASLHLKVVESSATPIALTAGVSTTGEICGEFNGKTAYEQAIVVQSPQGLIVLVGCAHPGLANMLRWVQKAFNNQPLHMLVGGFHLRDMRSEAIEQVIAELKTLGVQNISPMHCTGRLATRLMKQTFGQCFMQLREGQIF
ncbi:MAG: hypothetical protein A2Y14_05055 [Verrucomicrobia bacterium GWF2_51_19]|nr:MAG: hypothetical protein A2Y14_05055 [Verrucomicrobia bacterium GWF2_51_19]HCJ11741.1 hypothetical protein [Opitutae bacterium]